MGKYHKIKFNLKVKHENYHVRMLDNLNLSESSHTKKAKIILTICWDGWYRSYINFVFKYFYRVFFQNKSPIYPFYGKTSRRSPLDQYLPASCFKYCFPEMAASALEQNSKSIYGLKLMNYRGKRTSLKKNTGFAFMLSFEKWNGGWNKWFN